MKENCGEQNLTPRDENNVKKLINEANDIISNSNNQNLDNIDVEYFGEQKKEEQTEVIFPLSEAAEVLGVPLSSLQKEAEEAMKSKEKTKDFLLRLFILELPKKYFRVYSPDFRVSCFEASLKKMPNGIIMLASRFIEDKANGPDPEYHNEVGLELFGEPKRIKQTEVIFPLSEAAEVLGVSLVSLQKEAEEAMTSKEKTKDFLQHLILFELPEKYHRGNYHEYSLKKMPNGIIMLASRFMEDKTNGPDPEYHNEVGLELFGEPKRIKQTEIIFSLAEAAYVLDIPLISLQKEAEKAMQNREETQDFLHDLISMKLPEKYHNGRLLEFEMKKMMDGTIMLGSRFDESELDPSGPDAKIAKIFNDHPELIMPSQKSERDYYNNLEKEHSKSEEYEKIKILDTKKYIGKPINEVINAVKLIYEVGREFPSKERPFLGVGMLTSIPFEDVPQKFKDGHRYYFIGSSSDGENNSETVTYIINPLGTEKIESYERGIDEKWTQDDRIFTIIDKKNRLIRGKLN